jgi:hypothetical protein
MALRVSDPFTRRLSLFTGKGGVGKSTVVAALALEARRRGMRPLVIELGHRASMQSIFGAGPIGHAPREVAPGVHASNIDLERALADYVAAHVPSGALARRIARSPMLGRFLGAAPAVGEVLTLARIEALLREEERGAPRWHPLLVDLDATGHALMFLELPRVFESLAGDAGPVRRLLDSFAALLADRAHTRLHVVTRPGKLPIQETLELCRRLEAEHAVPLGTLFVNHAPSAPAIDEALLEALRARVREPTAACDLALAQRALADARALTRGLARLTALALPTVRLPHIAEPIDTDALATLGRAAGATA